MTVATIAIPPLADFHEQCRRHDWFYEYSDDHSVFERGHGEREALRAIARQSPAHDHLYRQWVDHVFQGAPKPQVTVEATASPSIATPERNP